MSEIDDSHVQPLCEINYQILICVAHQREDDFYAFAF
jgi:hypothetical protein